MAKRRPIAVNLSAHHANGIATPAHTITDVQSVTIAAPAVEWLDKVDIDFNKDGSLTVRVRYPNPQDAETWASADLTVRSDGTISLHH